MFRQVVIAVLLLIPSISIGQKIRCFLVDGTNNQPISYAHIVNETNNTGTISNMNGYFEIPVSSGSDSIVISFIGYSRFTGNAEELLNRDTLRLKRTSTKLREATILADDAVLIELIAEASKKEHNEELTGKTYLALQTKINNRKVEQFEGYYNGNFKGYDVDNLNLKAGRIGMRHFNNLYFVSLETSKAIYLNKLFEDDNYFPSSPFEYHKWLLRRNFSFSLSQRYKDENGHIVYVIDYEPKRNKKSSFSGTAWIDSTSMVLKKVNLNISKASTHPLIPLHKNNEIEQIDMRIAKTFESVNDRQFIKSIDFDYQLLYKNRKGRRYIVNTNAVLYAYDLDEQFNLPFFNFESQTNDFRKMSVIGYDTLFWTELRDFELSNQEEVEQFINDSAFINTITLFKPKENHAPHSALRKTGFFEHNYTKWNQKRILLKSKPDEIHEQDPYEPVILENLYQLTAQLYVDVTPVADSLSIRTATIFDPYKSFYKMKLDSKAMAFINMFFDLYEMQRIEMEKELEDVKEINEVERIYQKHSQIAEETTEEYMDDVNLGKDKEAMEKWNDRIVRNLNIDNLKLFDPYAEK
ncbi:carboxypeptidase-like regulatory domain-containing protein [Salibacter halophilus]|uniref:Carboxypeptidase-like regulatory domain-containing protein n=1 Tax=Salibacter halophilus TaxID=1803916 RepID=A0A6N6M4T3_9FLAO|nr:carboxypeptidase-like regulatory domain-containing protein [Salibacter halophilus]KAB1062014.1 carboxypeptidase-like regulatory domain-containing protein [Salibacter halophilus]